MAQAVGNIIRRQKTNESSVNQTTNNSNTSINTIPKTETKYTESLSKSKSESEIANEFSYWWWIFYIGIGLIMSYAVYYEMTWDVKSKKVVSTGGGSTGNACFLWLTPIIHIVVYVLAISIPLTAICYFKPIVIN